MPLTGEQGHVDLTPGEAVSLVSAGELATETHFYCCNSFTLLAAIAAFVQVGRYWAHEPPGAFTAELGRQTGAVALGTRESASLLPAHSGSRSPSMIFEYKVSVETIPFVHLLSCSVYSPDGY